MNTITSKFHKDKFVCADTITGNTIFQHDNLNRACQYLAYYRTISNDKLWIYKKIGNTMQYRKITLRLMSKIVSDICSVTDELG